MRSLILHVIKKIALPSVVIFAFFSCKNNDTLFTAIPSSKSGIDFINRIVENDSINELDIENVYNGGGIGVGDFNNDGLPDLYFTGNLVSNKLYLNQGNFKFKDVTEQAGVTGEGRWSRGVAVVDINNDGLLDIYVCATLNSRSGRKNLLYINQGINKDGIPQFTEMAEAYGLADSGHSTQAAFFDYDNDGDLDVYIGTNEINRLEFPDNFRPVIKDGINPSTGRLYRNDFDSTLRHPVFTDVSKEAGIQIEGYAHAVTIADINMDGWKDIYVANDFIPNDLLWINNGDGTFTESLSHYFKHTSANAMGNDIVDINNDGLADVITLDMSPEDNYRKKTMMNGNSYQKYLNSDRFNYNYQYVRNTLQLNRGNRILENDNIGDPIFSEIGFLAGISQTDWSWTPVVADFNNDGNRDIIITNGFPKDITDHDFINYRSQATQIASKQHLLEQIPEVKLHNYAFQNTGHLVFQDVTRSWGVSVPSFSNGAVYADLDNDGDLDLIINNINDAASVYKNNLRERKAGSDNFIKLKFSGSEKNKNGIGAFATIYYDGGKKQYWENSPYRGYLSSLQNEAFFGIGASNKIDSIIVVWPVEKRLQRMVNVPAGQTVNVRMEDATEEMHFERPTINPSTIFTDITSSAGIKYVDSEDDYIDFNVQKLLIHKFSQYGPALAAGDINGDGLEDFIVGGSANRSAQLFLQRRDGTFAQRPLLTNEAAQQKAADDRGILLFDADGDGDLDLYISSGGYENPSQSPSYRDRFFINDGKGHFKEDSNSFPQNFTSKFCVRTVDFDKDGDLDLFIAGRVDPGKYPMPVSSFIYRNDSKNGSIRFTDVTSEVAPELQNAGLICDAIFSDFDNDGWPDLILAGEWAPITFLKNEKGKFRNVTESTGISGRLGWWNTIAAGDFDKDGDIDYLVGNLGDNSFFKASDSQPVRIYAKDFDKNGLYDAFTTIFLKPSITDTSKKEFMAFSRDDVLKQMIGIRKKYADYKSFANAGFHDMLSAEQLNDALILEANTLQSCYLRNDGNGKFSLIPLPIEAQFSALCGMLVDDFDGDGNLDVLINGNDYGTEVSSGRFDALNGLLLKGNGTGAFTPLSIYESGIFIPGDGKALVKLQSPTGYLVAASQNRGPLKLFKMKAKVRNIPVEKNDSYAVIHYKNGQIERRELYHGYSFLSQSGRFISTGENVNLIDIFDVYGNHRQLQAK